MSVEVLLTILTQFTFLVVAFSTLAYWAKYRNRARFDVALVFLSLGLAIIAQDLQRILPEWEALLTLIFFAALLCHPYLLLRVAQYFHPIPASIHRTALIGLILVVASTLLSESVPMLVFTFAIGYFLIFEGYAAYLLIKGARTFSGVVRRRLRLASAGSGLLVLVFFVMLTMVLYGTTRQLTPAVETFLASLIQILAMLSGLSYYFGFSPPRWVRRTWQLRELYKFLHQLSKRRDHDRLSAFEELATAMLRTVGGKTAVIASWDEEGEKLIVEVPGNPPLQIGNLEAELAHNGHPWHEQPSLVARIPHEIGPGINTWAEQFGARALFIVPIKSESRLWGVLIIALRYAPLFARDDLEILDLLVEQSAITLGHSALLAELRTANLSLEKEISERRQVEEKFRGVLESAPDAMVVVDRAGSIKLINSQTEKIFRYDRAELVGQSVETLVPDRFRKRHVKHRDIYYIEHPARPMGIGLDLFGLRKDGSEFPIEISLSPLDAEGELLIIAAIRDITEWKHTEADIQQLNRDLKQYAAQLESSNKELESFSYSVSHDLRAPLRGIDGFSQVLLEDYSEYLPPEGRGYLERVRASAQRMAMLIDDLISLARVTRSSPQPKLINLSEMVESVLNSLRDQDPERHVNLSIEIDLRVNGDPNLMRIALENLLGNAWKFTSKKEQATIEFGHQKMNGERTFFVRDNGAGFDMTYAGKLFGAFQRLHSISEFPGTGIGLATVQRIIKLHGGRIWAEGEEGKGAAFYFTL